jgi:hypothetical protein
MATTGSFTPLQHKGNLPFLVARGLVARAILDTVMKRKLSNPLVVITPWISNSPIMVYLLQIPFLNIHQQQQVQTLPHVLWL